MLNELCQQFRDRFEPGGSTVDLHRRRCSECDIWAQGLESVFTEPPKRPLPAGLAARLRAIPKQVVLCRDVERLYQETRRRAADTAENVPAVVEHFENCERCNKLYGVLESALLEPPEPLPRDLKPRLLSFVRQPAWVHSRWLRDTRYAAAACLLLTASLTFVVDDAAAALKHAKGSMRTTTEALARTGQVHHQAAKEAVTNRVEMLYIEGRQYLSDLGSEWRRLVNETLKELEAAEHHLLHKPLMHNEKIQ